MITGIFTELEARVPLVVLGSDGQEQGISAVLDTGFSGYLTLPMSVITALDLPWIGRGRALIGDGTIQVFDHYGATLLWDDRSVAIEVAKAEAVPLLGMSLIYGHELKLQAIEDGAVTLEKLFVM